MQVVTLRHSASDYSVGRSREEGLATRSRSEVTYPSAVLSFMGSCGAVVTAAAIAAMSVSVGAAPAMADSSAAPGAPTITSVSTGGVNGQLLVAYSPPASTAGAITSYQATIDGGSNWLTCSNGTSGTCPLINLPIGQKFTIQLRAVNSAGPGAASTPATGTAEGPDPDKPGAISGSKLSVTASFNAAGNSLGVNAATTALGVGTLPRLTFSRSIAQKKVVETHLKVKAIDGSGVSRDVAGSWGWLDDRTVVFRPADFWPGNSTITITSTLDGAVLGKSSSGTLVGAPSLRKDYSFRTGRSFIARVDGKKHKMNIFIDGVKVKTFGVSLGQKEWETTSGVKVISSQKEPKHTYTSASLELTGSADIFDPQYYNLTDVPWNTRLTPTGEFIHAAPWAYGRIGRWNGSHGCTNMFEKDAKWIYDNTIPGDVVVYTNTGGQTLSPGNGPGGLWNVPWQNWQKKSALAGSPDVSNPATTAPAQSGPGATA